MATMIARSPARRAHLLVLAVALLLLSASALAGRGGGGGHGSSSRTCLRLVGSAIDKAARRFSGKICDTHRIRREIERECRRGLCAGKSSFKCKRAILFKLRKRIFPKHCEDDVCVPEVCDSSTQCRDTTAPHLAYPRNCPEKCEATSGCPNTVECVPNPPTCSDGKELNEDSCECETPPDCRNDSECPDGPNACFRGKCHLGVCKLVTTANCCVNDATRTMTDSECDADSPLCGLADRSPIAQGATGDACFVCENDRTGTWKDSGCTPEIPLCGDDMRDTIDPDDLGDKCYKCQNDKEGADTDLGCPDDMPLCGGESGDVLALGSLGDECFTCLNDPTADVDPGCSDPLPNCNADPNAFGSVCVECLSASDCDSGNACMPAACVSNVCEMPTSSDCCINDAAGADTDAECTMTTPLCGNADRTVIDTDAVGEECFKCLNNETGSEKDIGCDDSAPLCVADHDLHGDSCAVCVNDKQDGSADEGCGANTPLCRGPMEMELDAGAVGEQCVECGVSNEIAVCFALDESGSICDNGPVCDAYSVDTVGFATTLVSELDSRADDAEFSVVTFSSAATVRSELDTAAAVTSVLGTIADDYQGGSTNTAAALQACRTILNTSSKPKLLVLLTDGEPTRSDNPDPVAEATKGDGITIVGVGVGSNIDQDRIALWASPDLAFMAGNFADLDQIAMTIGSTEICVG